MEVSSGFKKLKTPRSLLDFAQDLHGKKVILTGGIFDFLKPIHVDLFDFAKKRGEYLVVAVESAGKYTPLEERLEILDAVENIDFLVTYTNFRDLSAIGKLAGELILNEEFDPSADIISFAGKSVRFSG